MQKGSVFEEGYGIIAKKVMIDKELSTTAKAIYGLFCAYGNASTGENAYPSIKYICDVLDIHKDTFYKHLQQLIDKDYIRKHKNKENGKFARNEYEIVVMPENEPFPNSSDTTSTDTKTPETIINSSRTTSSNSNSNTYMTPRKSSEFMRIYLELYEKHTGEEHKAIEESKLYKAESLLETIWKQSYTEMEFEDELMEYFNDVDAEFPTLNYFMSVAARYFPAAHKEWYVYHE